MALIEQTAKRTARTKTFQDDGNPRLKRLVSSVADLHYFDGTAWQEIDESIIDGTVSGFVHKCDRLRHATHIGATGTRRWMPRRDHPAEYIEFGRLQSWSGSAWQNVNLGTATRSGNKISWSVTAFDLSLTVTWNRVKIFAVLKTEAARRRLRWAVTLNGLSYNSGTLTAASDSVVVGRVDLPVAWDVNGSAANHNVSITTTYSGGFIEFGGDLSGAVLPITIDPTLSTQPDAAAGVDTVIYNWAADNNYSTDSYAEVTLNSNILTKFDLSTLEDTTIDAATLSFYVQDAVAWGTRSVKVSRILAANSAWTESGATWNYAVATSTRWAGDAGSNGGTDAGCSVSGTDYSSTPLATKNMDSGFAVNSEFAFTLDGTEFTAMVDANYGMVVTCTADADLSAFYTSDYTTAGSRPKLVVDYTEGGGTAYTLTAEAGSFAETGVDANALFNRRVAAEAGGYTYSGIDANTLFSRRIAADSGSFAYTGLDSGLIFGHRLAADPGTFLLSGIDANTLFNHRAAAEAGVYALSGNDALLSYGAAGAYVLSADQGSFLAGGQDANFLYARILAAMSGAFALSGYDVLFNAGSGWYCGSGEADAEGITGAGPGRGDWNIG